MRWIGENCEAEERREAVFAALNGRPKNVGRGIEEMPFGPPVRSAQLISTRRMISPKASVTMAR